MQNNSDRLDMPGGFKDNIVNDTSFSSSSYPHGTSATNNPDSTPIATAMRSANVVNPHGSTYEIAGPTTGGTSPIHNRDLDAIKDQSFSDPTDAPSGTPAHGFAETVKDNATAAATGAAAAGASVLAAAKKLVSGRGGHENELGDYNQHDSSFQPISNINNTISPVSPIASSSITSSTISTPSPKPLGPNDRPPIKVGVLAHKPSDKATYGNFDSPGAQNHPGPLSDRALADTPPPSSTPKRTIADPFGPLMVANWNDHKRRPDVSTPTSEDFDSPNLGTPTRSFKSPSGQPAAAVAPQRMHAPSPLRENVPLVKKADAVPIAQPTGYFPHDQNSSTKDAATTPLHSSTMTAAAPPHENKEPLTARMKDVFSHHDHSHTTATAATAATVSAAGAPAAVPASHQPVVSETSQTATATKPAVVKMEPLGERINEILHHESHPTVEVPIKDNTATTATSSAAPEVFTDRTVYAPVENLKAIDHTKVAQAASHMQPVQTSVPEKTTTTTTATTPAASRTVNAKRRESLSDRVKEIFHHDSSTPATVHHDEPIKTTAANTTTPTVEKESLVDHIKDVFRRDGHSSETVPHTTTTSSHMSAVPVAATAATAGTAASVAAFLKNKESDNTTTTADAHDKESDNMTTPADAHDHRDYVPPGTKSAIPTTTTVPTPAHEEIWSHVFMPVDASPLKKRTPVPAPVFDMTYMNTPATSSTTHSSIPAAGDNRSMGTKVKNALGFHDSSEYGPADTKDLPLSDPKTVHSMDRTPAAAASVATGPSTNEMQFTDPKTLRPVTEQRTWDIPTTVDNRSMGTKIMDAMTFHNSSEYGPADPKDLPLSDPKSLHLMDRAPATAAATAAVAAPLVAKSMTTPTTTSAGDASVAAPAVTPAVAPSTATWPRASEIQFTNPKTLRPVTEQRTWDIPTTVDNRSMGTKIMDAMKFHSSSEYGPADPKDLPLSDPKSLRLMDRAPATAAATAAVAAPLVAKSMTTPTTAHAGDASVDAQVAAPSVAPAIAPSAATGPSTNEMLFTDPKTLRPMTEQRTWDIPTTADNRSMGTKIMDTMKFHSSSEYGPADPKDLPLSDTKTLHLMDRAPATAAATTAVASPLVAKSMTTPTTTSAGDASVAAPAVTPAVAPSTATWPRASEMQFTDPKTLRPVTEQRTWDIPTPADNRSMGTKIMDAMTFHDSSEYGPADPKDLPLSDPKSLHLMNRLPVAAAATAAGVATVAVPLIHKATTTTTDIKPVVVKKDKHNPVLSAPRPVIPVTTAITEPNPVLSAPHPIIPEKKISTTQVDPTPVQTASRPMIPASAIEDYSTTGRTASPSHPVIPMANKQTTATTTSHHSGLEKAAAPIAAAAAAAPIIQHHHQQQQQHTTPVPVAQQQQQQQEHTTPVPVAQQQQQQQEHTTPVPVAQQQQQQQEYTTPVPVAQQQHTIPVPVAQQQQQQQEHTTPVPVAQQQHTTPVPVTQQQHQQQQHEVPATTTTTPNNTSSYNTGSYNTPAPAAPVATQRISPSTEVSAVDKTASAIPESYSGPVPQLHPGEEIVWVKTVTTTNFYDDESSPAPPGTVVNNTKNNGSNHNNGSDHNNGVAPVGVPANTAHDNRAHGHKRLSGFFDRLIHRHHDNVDKGKQRM